MDMKRILITLVALVAVLAGCNGKEKPQVLDQGAMLYINVNQKMMKSAVDPTQVVEGQVRYTPRQVVEKAGGFIMDTPDGIKDGPLAIGPEQKDLENERIKMWGEQVIKANGELNPYFIDCRNIRIVQGRTAENGGDFIVAYIPNSVMIEASKKIREAYNRGDYDTVYQLFHEAYTAIPITDAEWWELKKAGQQ